MTIRPKPGCNLMLCSPCFIKHVAEASVEPAFTGRVVALAVDMLVQYVRVVPAESLDFLLETTTCVIHERIVATVPELTVPLDRP